MAASRQRDPSFDDAAQQILRARREGRLVDASIGLERWVASCRQPSSAGASSSLPEMSSGLQTMGSSGMLSKLAARSGLGRQGSTVSSSLSSGDDAEEEMVASLRERMPRLRKLVEKEGVAGESVYLAAICLKHNERGKVQERLLLVSDQAVYNLKVDGKKVVCKRRIPLSHIAYVTISEPLSQFVLHVPSEYDYLYSTPHCGYSAIDDDLAPGASPLAAVVAAIQRAYTVGGGGHALPVSTFNEHGSMANLVKKKSFWTEQREEDSGRRSFGEEEED